VTESGLTEKNLIMWRDKPSLFVMTRSILRLAPSAIKLIPDTTEVPELEDDY
jgi:hypothetical protein